MSMTQEELERVYDKPDPWGYQTNPADEVRKFKILNRIGDLAKEEPIDRALDIGCGEGWITKDLPAKEIYGYELSMQAIARWPGIIKLFVPLNFEPLQFDLILMTGCLYENYVWSKMVKIANICGTKYLVTCNIAEREYEPAIDLIKTHWSLIQYEQFPYDRGDEKFTQRLRIFRR